MMKINKIDRKIPTTAARTPNRIPKKNRNGDCYEVSAKYVLNSQFKELSSLIPEEVLKEMDKHGITRPSNDIFLVHGEVTGQSPIEGVKYGHAWVEIGDSTVIDNSNGRNIEMPKALYYALGRIERTIRYTPEQTREMVLKYSHWGPWELKTRY